MLENFFKLPIAWFHWDPSANIVTLPYVGLPLTWYGLLFATGFWLGFHIFVSMFKRYLALKPEFVEGDVNWLAFARSNALDLVNLEKGNIASCNTYLKNWRKPQPFKEKSEASLLVSECRKAKGDDVAKLLEKRLTLESNYPKIFTPLKLRAKDFAEKLILYVIAATVIGARLGHIIFYEHLSDYLKNPLGILKTWEGGLASHGGIIAIIFAVWIFYRSSKKKYSDFSWYMLLDGIAIPTMLVSGLIRIGNFFNQEVLGTESAMPWAIIFDHPADGSLAVPRHPVQLYESLFYLGIFVLLLVLWRKYANKWQPGRFCGIALFSSFIFRFFVEFIKTGQSIWFDSPNSMLLMGQMLSIPLSLIGAYLIFRKKKVLS